MNTSILYDIIWSVAKNGHPWVCDTIWNAAKNVVRQILCESIQTVISHVHIIIIFNYVFSLKYCLYHSLLFNNKELSNKILRNHVHYSPAIFLSL